MSRRALLAALLALVAASGQAQGPAYLVKDIKTQQGPFELDLPRWHDQVALDGFGLFVANDGVHGEELWRWSPAGVLERVADICPGICSSYPQELVVAGDLAYFRADDGAHGWQLWASDGTAAGTRLVRELGLGDRGASPYFLTAVGDRLFFAAGAGFLLDQELWVSDGTVEGTYQVADIRPGEGGSNPVSLVDWNGVLYFTASDGVHGREIWRSDGTERGTELVLDLCPGPSDCYWEEQSTPWGSRTLQVLGDRLLLRPGATGWTSLMSLDAVGTAVELVPQAHGLVPFPVLDGEAYFTGCDAGWDCEPWKTDGTPGGTSRVKDVREGSESSSVLMLRAAGDLVFFYASHDGEGRELWKTDGTERGTQRVKDIYPGPESSQYLLTTPFDRLGDRLVFGAWDGVHGIELWVSDGSEEGTFLLADANPGPNSGLWDYLWPQTGAEVDGHLGYFILHEVLGATFWVTDGTVEGTWQVADLDGQTSSTDTSTLHGPVLRAAQDSGRLVFGARDDEHGTELWVSDGTAVGTELVADLLPGEEYPGIPRSSRPISFAGGLEPYVVSAHQGVWSVDRVSGEAEQLGPRYAGSRMHVLRPEVPGGAPTVLFIADDVLSASDGTAAGTEPLAAGSGAGQSLRLGDTVLFSRQTVSGYELWRTEGTVPSTEIVADIEPGPGSSYPQFLGALGKVALFSAWRQDTGEELWRSDGTPEGTWMVADLRPGPVGSEPTLLPFDAPAAITSRGLFFVADDGETGAELWVTDGEADGTHRVADLRPGAAGSFPTEIVALGDSVFYVADDGLRGRELWTTDGKPGRVRLVKDIHPREGSSVPRRRLGSRLVAAGGRLYFGATDGVHGVELWTSDGTRRGTRMLQDIHPGPGSSSPENFVVAGNCLYFSATDGEHGFELWALPLLPTSGSNCAPPGSAQRPPAASPR